MLINKMGQEQIKHHIDSFEPQWTKQDPNGQQQCFCYQRGRSEDGKSGDTAQEHVQRAHKFNSKLLSTPKKRLKQLLYSTAQTRNATHSPHKHSQSPTVQPFSKASVTTDNQGQLNGPAYRELMNLRQQKHHIEEMERQLRVRKNSHAQQKTTTALKRHSARPVNQLALSLQRAH